MSTPRKYLLFLALLATSCAPSITSRKTDAFKGKAVVFLQGGGDLPAIDRELQGRLSLNAAGCLYLKSVSDLLIIWPPEASYHEGNKTILTPRTGAIRVGDHLALAGTPFQSLGSRFVGSTRVPKACSGMMAILVNKGGIIKR